MNHYTHNDIIQTVESPNYDAPLSDEFKATASSVLDDDKHYCNVDLLKHVDKAHILKQLSISVSKATKMPVNSVFLAGLSTFSSIACRKWRVKYKDGDDCLPIGLYTVIEQPPGMAKSRTLKEFQRPFFKGKEYHYDNCNFEIQRLKKEKGSLKEGNYERSNELEQEIDRIKEVLGNKLFSTNTTPESLEADLHTSKGFFSCVSSEQGLIDSLLGLSYGDNKKANNNDLILNGFDGGDVSNGRIGRKAYCGIVAGGITLFAQPGSSDKVFKASNGTGLCDRFNFLTEKDNLGYCDFTNQYIIERNLVDEYSNRCDWVSDCLMNPCKYNELPYLIINAESWDIINQFRNELEPHLRPGGKYSYHSISGAVRKVDMQIMKIAANLHILSNSFSNNTISSDLVNSAISITRELTEARLGLFTDKGLIGTKAEYSAIIGYLSKKPSNTGAKLSDIKNSLKGTQPFRSMNSKVSAAIEKSVNEMLEKKLLLLKGDFYLLV